MRLFPLLLILMLFSCRQKKQDGIKKQTIENTTDSTLEKKYFPVTEFILGEIHGIRDKGINPIKKTGHDSVFLKIESLEKEMADFLTPVITQTSMVPFFTESSFMDQTTNYYTFTYDPREILPDSISLRHWDVYVDPKKSTVWRIYMLKEGPETMRQLTWEAGRRCQIVELSKDSTGALSLFRETTIRWDY